MGQAFTFDGQDDNIQIPDSGQWNFGTINDFTFDFWEKSSVAAGTREHALSFEPDVNNNRNLDFNFNDSNGIYVYWNSGGSNQILGRRGLRLHRRRMAPYRLNPSWINTHFF